MTSDDMPLPKLKTVIKRLPVIFPEGIEHRNYVVREMAARTIFVMLYAGALEGTGRWLRPDQVTKMTNAQAAKNSEDQRLAWARLSLKPGGLKGLKGTWYAANTREPIRDETLRFGLIPTGAVVERRGLPTTSALPRYALERNFADLLDEALSRKKFEEKAEKWRETHLSAGALARVKLVKRGAVNKLDTVRVEFPNGETRLLSPGPSSAISKAVIQEFARRYLHAPAVLWLSESGNKVVAWDDGLAKAIGIRIEASRNLPDIILIDTGNGKFLVVFVEVVATDGPINQKRKESLLKLALDAGFDVRQIAFLTAFSDRAADAYRKAASEIAWGSFVWFASEPDHVIVLRDGRYESKKLAELL